MDEDAEVEPRRSKSTWQVRKRRTGANNVDFVTPERSEPQTPDRSIENLEDIDLNETYFEPHKRRLSWWNVLLPDNLRGNR